MTALTSPMFQNEDAARAHLELQRWPDGVVCAHCGCTGKDHITAIKGARARPSKAHPEGAERKGLYQCNGCRQQFTVTVGTIFERSKVPLHKWLLATYLLTSSKKGMSAHQLHRTLGVTYKTAWFMFHRIREAMIETTGTAGPIGGEGKIVEADETYYGRAGMKTAMNQKQPGFGKHRDQRPKRAVVSLVERGGPVRSFHVKTASRESVREILVKNASRKSKLYTDESKLYTKTGEEFAEHRTVRHSRKEYVRGEVHSNTVENYFSVFKRGMRGIYQHCGEAHLQRYLTEFDFRYNRRSALGYDDAARHADLLRMVEGKRLTYRRTGEAGHA